MSDLPAVYHIEIKDGVDGITYKHDVMAFSLLEAMQKALDSHNDGYTDPPQGLETVTVAQKISEDIYLFSDTFKRWFEKHY